MYLSSFSLIKLFFGTQGYWTSDFRKCVRWLAPSLWLFHREINFDTIGFWGTHWILGYTSRCIFPENPRCHWMDLNSFRLEPIVIPIELVISYYLLISVSFPENPRCHWTFANFTGKPLSLPAPMPTTCPNIKKHCVLWDKMHMSMIMAFILQRTA